MSNKDTIVDVPTVNKIARLSRLDIPEVNKESLTNDLNNIVEVIIIISIISKSPIVIPLSLKFIIKHIFFGHQHITSSGSYCGITFSSPRSTWSPLIPNFSNEYRLGTANTDTNYNVAIIRSDALIIHTEDFLKTEVNWFK